MFLGEDRCGAFVTCGTGSDIFTNGVDRDGRGASSGDDQRFRRKKLDNILNLNEITLMHYYLINPIIFMKVLFLVLLTLDALKEQV